MLGLLRGTVALCAHDAIWHVQAEETIALLRRLLGDAVVAAEHVGSTAVPGLAAKPIIDIAVAVRDLRDMDPFCERLAQEGIREACQDLPGQRLFVMGDFAKNTRTHHIHAVIWDSSAWRNYIRFRDYLCAFEDKRAEYEAEKRNLAAMYPQDRTMYTQKKSAIVEMLLAQANQWVQERENDG